MTIFRPLNERYPKRSWAVLFIHAWMMCLRELLLTKGQVQCKGIINQNKSKEVCWKYNKCHAVAKRD